MSDKLEQAKALLEEQEFDKALEILRGVESISTEQKTLIARALSGLGKWKQAHSLFTEVIAEDSKDHEAWAGRGLLFFFAGQMQQAHHDYSQAIEMAPLRGRYRGLRGVLLGQVGDAPAALDDLVKAYDLGDHDPTYIMARAQIFMALNDAAQAQEMLKLAEQHQADEAALSSLEGALAMLNGNPKEALASYRFATEKAPKVLDNWLNLLALTAKLDRPRLSEEADRALEAHPYHEQFVTLKVGTFLEKGKSKSAFEFLAEAIEHNPESPLLHFQMGMGKAKFGKFEEAAEAFTKALALRPRFPRALDARGNCLEQLGKKEEAQKDFEESARIRTEDAQRMAAAQAAQQPPQEEAPPEE